MNILFFGFFFFLCVLEYPVENVDMNIFLCGLSCSNCKVDMSIL